MAALSRLRVIVVGAGVLGLASAWRLAQAGAQVVVHDPAILGDSASGVAAGMLAPALEAVLDPASAGHFPLFQAAKEGWPGLIEGLGPSGNLVRRSGALFLARDAAYADVAARLTAVGASWRPVDRQTAESLAPGLSAEDDALFIPDDWLAAPAAVLGAFAAGIRDFGGGFSRDAVVADDGALRFHDGRPLEADLVVVTTGIGGRGLSDALPELKALQPIKGQILRYVGGPVSGAVVRTLSGYVAPQAAGAVAGATMEPGLDDRSLDDRALQRLAREAGRLFPGLQGAAYAGRAGVRAGTVDGLPLVGRSSGDARAVLAVGARRNGWLLAPLVADAVLTLALERPLGPFSSLFAPDRFGD